VLVAINRAAGRLIERCRARQQLSAFRDPNGHGSGFRQFRRGKIDLDLHERPLRIAGWGSGRAP